MLVSCHNTAWSQNPEDLDMEETVEDGKFKNKILKQELFKGTCCLNILNNVLTCKNSQ
jgi:hypothetical protein